MRSKNYAQRASAAALSLLLMISAVCLPSCNGAKTVYTASYFDVFDTVVTVSGSSDSREEFNALCELIHSELMKYHRLFDIYNGYEGINNLKTINDAAGSGEAVKVDREIIELLDMCALYEDRSGGKLLVTSGALLRLWHDYREAGVALPSQQEITEATLHISSDVLVIDGENSTVMLTDKGASIDVGAVAKGYAVQNAADAARDAGADSLMINAGGNVVTVGCRPDGEKWQIGIDNPITRERVVVRCSDASVVTSGNYERYYVVDGEKYHHIIDPHTGYPAEGFSSVSVIARSSVDADALSTSLFLMGLDEGLALIEGLEDCEAMWIDCDGRVICSSGWGEYEKGE